jgi:hypothetical protein
VRTVSDCSLVCSRKRVFAGSALSFVDKKEYAEGIILHNYKSRRMFPKSRRMFTESRRMFPESSGPRAGKKARKVVAVVLPKGALAGNF